MESEKQHDEEKLSNEQDEDNPEDKEDEEDEEDEETSSRIALLESRVVNCEHVNGIPNRHAPLALPIAILVLLANVAFVVGFTIHQQRNTCVPNASLLDGDLQAFANRLIFKDSGSVFVCTTQFNNLLLPSDDATNDTSFWTPCTLRGLTADEYDLKELVCPTVYNGCYEIRPGSDGTDPADIAPVEVCEAEGRQAEVVCEGVVSITYYTCPNAGTTIGASLGYSGLVEFGALLVFVVLYMVLVCICTRKCYSFQTYLETFGTPGATFEEVDKAKKEAIAKEDPASP